VSCRLADDELVLRADCILDLISLAGLAQSDHILDAPEGGRPNLRRQTLKTFR